MASSIIVSNPAILSGEPVFRGTRVPFRSLTDYLEHGRTLSEFLEDFPSVTSAEAIAAIEEARTSLTMSCVAGLSVALRSLARTKGLAVTVVLTLALGIGANAAIFSLVRGVLLRPLVNSDEERLICIQQSAPGISPGGVPFSVPEIQDLRASVKTFTSVGWFSTVGSTMIALG